MVAQKCSNPLLLKKKNLPKRKLVRRNSQRRNNPKKNNLKRSNLRKKSQKKKIPKKNNNPKKRLSLNLNQKNKLPLFKKMRDGLKSKDQLKLRMIRSLFFKNFKFLRKKAKTQTENKSQSPAAPVPVVEEKTTPVNT